MKYLSVVTLTWQFWSIFQALSKNAENFDVFKHYNHARIFSVFFKRIQNAQNFDMFTKKT